MHYLFQLRRDEYRWLLPIADRSAVLLEEVLLEPSTEGREKRLSAAIMQDPFLAMWLVETIAGHETSTIDTLAKAVRWFASGTAQKLSERIVENPAAVSAADAVHYATAAADAWATIANPNSSVDDDSEIWQSFITGSRQLLACCPRDSFVRQRLLPSFTPFAPPYRQTSAMQVELPTESVNSTVRAYLLDNVPEVTQRLPALVNRLAELGRSAQALETGLEQRKLAALKELAYGASHEINNPLANIAARAQTLLRDEANPQRRRKMSAIFEQAMRAHEMIADLMLFAHPPKLEPVSCNLTEIARGTIANFLDEAQRNQVELCFVDGAEDIELLADPIQLTVAIRAVLKNAVEAVGHGGQVRVGINADDDSARLFVSDDGPGIPDQVRNHIFDPFFSGRESGRGLGFGLSKCWRIVTEHGGQMEVKPIVPHGSEFTITLPRITAA